MFNQILFILVLVTACCCVQCTAVENKIEILQFTGIDPAAFINLGNRTYYISPMGTKSSAKESINFCSDLGLSLASFETFEEWDIFKEYYDTTYVEGIENDQRRWISGIRFFEGSYFWSGVGAFATQLRWEEGYPSYLSNYNEEWCLLVDPLSNIQDNWCTFEWGFFCERNNCD